jgi:hypothetical protein
MIGAEQRLNPNWCLGSILASRCHAPKSPFCCYAKTAFNAAPHQNGRAMARNTGYRNPDNVSEGERLRIAETASAIRPQWPPADDEHNQWPRQPLHPIVPQPAWPEPGCESMPRRHLAVRCAQVIRFRWPSPASRASSDAIRASAPLGILAGVRQPSGLPLRCRRQKASAQDGPVQGPPPFREASRWTAPRLAVNRRIPRRMCEGARRVIPGTRRKTPRFDLQGRREIAARAPEVRVFHVVPGP